MRLTLYGFYNYDSTLFDNITLPDGIEKEYVVNEILKRGDLYTYHQALPQLKQNITYWFLRKRFDFEMIYKALRTEYDPLENYDRKEEIRRETSRNGSDTTTGSNNASTNSSLTRNEELHDNTTNTTNASAYNSSTFQPTEQVAAVKGANTSSTDITDSSANGSSSSTTSYGSGSVESETNRLHGQIGVTKYSELIADEMKTRSDFDMYAVIADMFEKDFLIQVY